jgi:hypothetical protein
MSLIRPVKHAQTSSNMTQSTPVPMTNASMRQVTGNDPDTIWWHDVQACESHCQAHSCFQPCQSPTWNATLFLSTAPMTDAKQCMRTCMYRQCVTIVWDGAGQSQNCRVVYPGAADTSLPNDDERLANRFQLGACSMGASVLGVVAGIATIEWMCMQQHPWQAWWPGVHLAT